MRVEKYRLAVGRGIRRSPFSGALSDARIRIRVTAKSARASQKEGLAFCQESIANVDNQAKSQRGENVVTASMLDTVDGGPLVHPSSKRPDKNMIVNDTVSLPIEPIGGRLSYESTTT